MDKDLLRIILIGLGIALTLGIYLWDRVKKRRSGSVMEFSKQEPKFTEEAIDENQANPSRPADLVQLAVVSTDPDGFDGSKLVDAFGRLQLKFGDMKIFHRYRPGTDNVDFSVATMTEPGTFPEENIGDFRTRGLAVFFQPSSVSEPLISFDAMVDFCCKLADRLSGEVWDPHKQPLTEETLRNLRQTLL